MHAHTLTPARLFTAFLLLWFAVLTSFGVVHNAQHGFHQHTHYGNECPVYEYCEHQNLGTGLPTLPLIFLVSVPYSPAVSAFATLTEIQPVNAAPARAPPHVS